MSGTAKKGKEQKLFPFFSALRLFVDADHDGGRLDDGVGLLADLEAELSKAQAKLDADKAALAGEHDICYGIRPEDIHDAEEFKSDETYEIDVAVAELLGHEYYIHSNFAGIDLVAKIPLVHKISIGDKMKLAFNFGKAHIFDPRSENRIY